MVSVKTKSVLIADIDELVRAVGDKFDFDEDGDAERDFIAQRCPARLQTAVRELPTLSMHLLAGIEDGPLSLVKLAARSGQLKGTVSKHVQRLVEAGLVQRAAIPGNRKETQLTLTADGRLVADAHRQLHAGDGPRFARLYEAVQQRGTSGAREGAPGSRVDQESRCTDHGAGIVAPCAVS